MHADLAAGLSVFWAAVPAAAEARGAPDLPELLDPDHAQARSLEEKARVARRMPRRSRPPCHAVRTQPLTLHAQCALRQLPSQAVASQQRHTWS